jgi:hypothetical protein
MILEALGWEKVIKKFLRKSRVWINFFEGVQIIFAPHKINLGSLVLLNIEKNPSGSPVSIFRAPYASIIDKPNILDLARKRAMGMSTN